MIPSSSRISAHLRKNRSIVTNANVLKHADRNDTIECSSYPPIVLKNKFRSLRKSTVCCSRIGDGALVLRQCYANDLCIADSRQIHCKAAHPHHVQNVLMRSCNQLGGKVPFLS